MSSAIVPISDRADEQGEGGHQAGGLPRHGLAYERFRFTDCLQPDGRVAQSASGRGGRPSRTADHDLCAAAPPRRACPPAFPPLPTSSLRPLPSFLARIPAHCSRVLRRTAAPRSRCSSAGTAFVFGFLHVSGTFDLTKLADMQFKTSLHFAQDAARLGGRTFDAQVDLFKIFLSQENMNAQKLWLSRARIWRCLFLQDPQGFWDCTSGIAPAIYADKSPLLPEGTEVPAWGMQGLGRCLRANDRVAEFAASVVGSARAAMAAVPASKVRARARERAALLVAGETKRSPPSAAQPHH